MPTLVEIRTAIKTTLDTALPKTAVYKRVPDNPVLPCVIVQPAVPSDYQVVFGRKADRWEFDLHVLVPSADSDVAQDTLDEYIAGVGELSIPAIIHANPTLGRADCSSAVLRLTAYGFRFQAVGVDHVGATLRMLVVATNS